MKTYLVKGCGVSLICTQGESMTQWIVDIITKGGVPVISEVLF